MLCVLIQRQGDEVGSVVVVVVVEGRGGGGEVGVVGVGIWSHERHYHELCMICIVVTNMGRAFLKRPGRWKVEGGGGYV